MEKIGGYAGKILYVDLTRRTSEAKPLSEELIRNFVGGTTMNARLAYEVIKPNTEWSSPENAILINIPPLMGTFAPAAGRASITSISPQTGSLAYSGTGGMGNLKFAGYDQLIITGKADRPVYIKILDDNIEIIDADDLWGQDTMNTTDILWNKYGDDWDVVCIGQAGENLVKYAAVNSNKFSLFAREGFGAVMGSKNLKALVIYGTKGIEVSDKKRFRKACDDARNLIMGGKFFGGWRKLGSLIALGHFVRAGLLPSKNQQEGAFEGIKDQIFSNKEFLTRLKAGDVACMSCPLGCKHSMKIQGGPYDGKVASLSCLLSTIQTFGVIYTIKNYDETIVCADLCDRYGMDYFSVVNAVSYATELYDRGIITKKDTGGIAMEWGSPELLKELMTKISLRQGFGDLLADGVYSMGQKIGGDAPKYAVTIKGVDTIYDPRVPVFSPELLILYVNSKGAYPTLQSWTLGTEMSPDKLKPIMNLLGIPQQSQERILGEPTGLREGGYNVPRLAKWYDEFYGLLDSLGLCSRDAFHILDADSIAGIYSALTGIEKSGREMLKDVERNYNIRQAFNIRSGYTTKNNMGPERWATETITWKGKEYGPITYELLESFLAQYYDERGWDQEGVPTSDKLEELGMGDIAKDLKDYFNK